MPAAGARHAASRDAGDQLEDARRAAIALHMRLEVVQTRLIDASRSGVPAELTAALGELDQVCWGMSDVVDMMR